MTEQKRNRNVRHPDGQADRLEERRDRSDADASSSLRGDTDDGREVMSSAMGGTSDAGTAADDAAESAAFGVGLPDDRTQRTTREREARTERRMGDRRGSGRTSPGDTGGHGA